MIIPTSDGTSAIAAVVREHPATVLDAINFVSDFQEKSERDFLAIHEKSALQGLSPLQYEDILIMQYERNQYSLEDTMNRLLSANGLMLETQVLDGVTLEDLFI